jgi:hypothetical protein
MIEIKILSYHSAQRYALRQTVISAQRTLKMEYPDLDLSIMELKNWYTIEKYTPILAAPSLVVNGKLVCSGRFPNRQEVLAWIKEAVEAEVNVSLS